MDHELVMPQLPEGIQYSISMCLLRRLSLLETLRTNSMQPPDMEPQDSEQHPLWVAFPALPFEPDKKAVNVYHSMEAHSLHLRAFWSKSSLH